MTIKTKRRLNTLEEIMFLLEHSQLTGQKSNKLEIKRTLDNNVVLFASKMCTANELNNYFASVGRNGASKIQKLKVAETLTSK